MPWFDLNIWSAWASIAGLVVSVVGLILSIWVLVRTYRVEQAIRMTEGDIYRRLSLPARIAKLDTILMDVHVLAMKWDDANHDKRHEPLGRLNAMLLQLQDIPDTKIHECLDRLKALRFYNLYLFSLKRGMSQERLFDIYEKLVELLDHIKEYKDRSDATGRR